ncbi:phosphoenolpyruvate carboxykinase (ATP) [Hymenobacter taeanensis]|uniref:Phosphoenolpyruvate carboxykinase (ATP) n=1 Tax=Hymenobacter taeanensis TaxID=2735321 RepID=A0A6M6BDU1_9BACT|nr:MULTISPECIES: phosphoenolpyruvate carboxykinase (ATP) [Hymenobacter]QJX46406.1 phosphoenolpyruvate carboxykinase (ATP) [Hymenobacter taeanensis]UOQ80267.1 phosphoenolpyruvate carboxykinase (ATP) [Hymenobacter sp. 5414T-23]
MENSPISTRLSPLGLTTTGQVHLNLTPSELIEHALRRGEGTLTDTGALMADTGAFTGRSPKDRFVVKDENTQDSVWWGDINIPFAADKFDQLQEKMTQYLADKEVFVRDAYAGANPDYQLKLRVVNELAWHNLFCYNMFLRPEEGADTSWTPDFSIICAPGFEADPAVDGTRQKNFAILNFTKKMILIGGTGYAGEMKKGIFGVLNYLLPHEKNTLSMHCSANVGQDGDTAIFFGLSGTGKTTLSADPNRGLIGDDEHGWTPDAGIFNFEGGCYAKVIDLSAEKEPEIWNAIRYGSIVENTRYVPGTRTVDYANKSVTENTRTAYPINFIPNAVEPSVAGTPKNIFFLTADAFGVLPPISKLDKCHAMYHFMSGYTAKVAGTEMGVTEPQTTFSACFGAVFLPLHPTKYAEMLGQKMDENEVNVWLVNTGWTGGSYGVGSRMKLAYTRAMITAALQGKLDDVEFHKHPIFGVEVPAAVPNVPSEILDPRDTWSDKEAYDHTAAELAEKFVKNFEKYASYANEDILAGAPKVTVAASV